jgi:hypothetical protein
MQSFDAQTFTDPTTGEHRPIWTLPHFLATNGALVQNIPDDRLPEPLLMPTLNERGQDEQPGPDDPLLLPVMNFDTTKGQKTARNSGDGLPEPLPLPSLR